MEVTARVDYAVRALLELAANDGSLATRDEIADAQQLPPRYLESILGELRQAGLVQAQRGAAGGYRLARPSSAITVADVARAVDGPLALVQGERPERVSHDGASAHLTDVWVALRAAIRSILEEVSLADLVSGELPGPVRSVLADPAAWEPR